MITPPPLVQAPPLAQAPPQVPPPVPRPEVRVEPVPATVVTADSIQEGVEITADQLDALFRTDKSAVHSKLSGKTIIIRGIVEKVFIREHLEIRYIMVTGSSKKLTWSIRCQFNKEDSQKAARLNEGQEVRLRAKYDSYSKNIIFKDCVLF
jgi:hypothetical protein